MTITTNPYQTHKLTIEEIDAMKKTYDIVKHLTEVYGEKCILASPNYGEIVMIEELPRVLGILSFIVDNGVVEVTCQEF